MKGDRGGYYASHFTPHLYPPRFSMKKLLPLIFVTLLLAGCASQESVDQLKLQNQLLQTQIEQQKQIMNLQNTIANTGVNQQKEVVQQPAKTTKKIENNNVKPDKVRITVSWLWWALSRQTSAIGESFYTSTNESYPINSEKGAQDYIWYWFNGWGYALIASCNDGYSMTKCVPFSKADYVENQTTQCFLWNEDPNLMRTSMIIECRKN